MSNRRGILREAAREMVDLTVLPRDVGVAAGLVFGRLEEEAVGVAHHVGLVPDRDLLAAVRARVLEREPDDPARAAHADRLDRDAAVGGELVAGQRFQLLAERGGLGGTLFVLDPGVEVLGVLPDHDEVDTRMPQPHARQRPRRPHRREEIEALAQRHVHAPEPGAHRRGDGALDRHASRADRVQGLLRHQRRRTRPARPSPRVARPTRCRRRRRPGPAVRRPPPPDRSRLRG